MKKERGIVVFGALEPPPGKSPAFAQLYVLDNHAIVDVVKGMQFGAKLNEDILERLADMLKIENAYVREFKVAASLDVPQLEVRISGRPGREARSYNRPRAAEIAVLIPDERSADVQANPRDIVIHKRGGGLQPDVCPKKMHWWFGSSVGRARKM